MRVRARWVAGSSVAGALAVAAAVAALWPPEAGPAAADQKPVATATIRRETLVDTVTVNGTLAFGPPSMAESRLAGTVTALAPMATTVQRGQPVFRIDDTPVVLFFGDVPAYRELSAGKAATPSTDPAIAPTPAVPAAQGRDVRQLEENLQALGYTGFTVDEAFTAQTATAVRRWQRDLGLPMTGVVELGRVFYAHGPIRIAEHKLAVGQVATGAVLSYTGTTRVVTAQVPAHNAELAKVGATVTVALPTGQEISGAIQSVGSSPQDQGGAEPTIEAVVALNPADAADGPVKVRLVADRRDQVLAVPVGALLALAEGGYGLEILDGDRSRIVAVQTGLFADGKVEVTGPDLREGLTVGMAR